MNRSVNIRTVNDKKVLNDFVRLPKEIYANNPFYVPDLDVEIRDFFNEDKNSGLKSAKVQAFVAYDQNNHPVGRIVGIINTRANEKWKSQNVRFGFIEFVDDIEVSKALIKAVEEWGKKEGMTDIQGPMGLTDFDKEGMLIEDFDQLGSMTAIYNPPYYPKHMEALGFVKEVDWVQIRVKIPKTVPEKFARVCELVKDRYKIYIKKLTKKQIMGEYGKKIFDILNSAYEPLFGFVALTPAQVQDFVSRYLPLADPELITLIENEQNEAIGVAISMGSLAKALNKSKGSLFPFGWYHLLKSLYIKHEDTVELMLIGLLPEYQGKGINSLFFCDLVACFNKKHYLYAETGPQLENNQKELMQWTLFDHKLVKRRRCYTRKIENNVNDY
ncbi:MAG: N-acetyltransferase [Prevotellaceae bacterium]|nr:N-acetyltransferase [Candidatus Colivivens equi]